MVPIRTRAGSPAEIPALLATHPEVVAALLRQHVPDEAQRCRGCTQPGYGTPYGRWPCLLYLYAHRASRARPAD